MAGTSQHTPAASDTDVPRSSLPLEAQVVRDASGVVIRLPVRAEQVRLDRRTVVVEQVTLRRETEVEMQRLTDTVRREQLSVQTLGDLDSTVEIPAAPLRAALREHPDDRVR